MQTPRPVIALDPRLFGKRRLWLAEHGPTAVSFGEDLKLFAVAYAVGFLFVSILIF